MKKRNIIVIFAGLFVLASLLFVGCNNVVSPSYQQAGGKGNVTVSFSAGKAALMPSVLDFDVYQFMFTKTGDGTVISETRGRNGPFTFSLEMGAAYTLEVKAYKGSISEENLGAAGISDPFTVIATTNVRVTLSGYLTKGDGTFSYNIKLPENAQVEKFELYLDDSNSITLPAYINNGVISSSVDAAAGRYLLILWLSKGAAEAEDYNGVTIYSNTVTFYGTEADPIVFKNSDFRDPTAPENNGKQVDEWHGFDIEGNYNYVFNYDPSYAVGTQYDVFTDTDGNTWNDVLKLEAPEGGFQRRSLTMIRPLEEAGTYYLSMWFWVDKGTENVNIFWYNTGGIYGDGAGWPIVVGSDRILQENEFGKWLFIEGDFYLRADEEIGIIARNNSNDYGIKDSTLYIRDLVLELNGESILDNANVKISTDSFTLVQGNTRSLKANVDVDWSSDNPGVATVNSNGLVSAVGVGTTTIRAVSKNDATKSAASVVTVVAQGTRFIALSFDDGPNGGMTPQFLEVLENYGAHATFMCVGQNVVGNIALLQTMDAAGHEIGNHTYNHDYSGPNAISIRSVESLYGEILQNQNAIHNAIGKTPVVFRAPALLYSREPDDLYAEKQYGENVEEACRLLGLALIDTTDHQRGNFDWDGRSAEAILATVKTLAKDWGIILLHDWPVNTLEALPDILEWLQGEGYSVLTVSELAAKRKAAVGLSPASDLEPGRIYYNLIDMPAHVSSISVDPVTIEVGQSAVLSAAVLPSAGQKVYWYSDNPYIASINQDTGRVTAVSPGAATIRAAAGGMRAFVTVTVNGEVIVPDPFDAITAWVDEDGFNIKGAAGIAQGDQYYSSNADWDVGNYKGYGNVLRLSPDPETGKYYWKPNGEPLPGGGLALTYEAPYKGRYYLSMEIWVDTDRNDAQIVWYNCWNWGELDGGKSVTVKRDWFTRSGAISLDEGDVLGLLAHSWYGDTDGWDGAGLKHSTIYIRDLKLVYLGPYGDGPEIDIMDIPSTAAPPPDEDQGITLKWEDNGIELTAEVSGGALVSQNPLTVRKGGTVEITAPAGYGSYEWRIGMQTIGSGRTCVFTAETAGNYEILLMVSSPQNGASIAIKVVE